MVSSREIVKSSYRCSGGLRLSGRKKVTPAPTAEAPFLVVATHIIVVATHIGEGEVSEQAFSPLLLTHLMESHVCHVLPLLEDALTKKASNSTHVLNKEKIKVD